MKKAFLNILKIIGISLALFVLVFIIQESARDPRLGVFSVVALITVWYVITFARRICVTRSVLDKIKHTDNDQSYLKSSWFKLLLPSVRYVEIESPYTDSRYVIIFVRRRYRRFHFDNLCSLEVYKGLRVNYKTGRDSYAIARKTTWKSEEKFTFPQTSMTHTNFIFTKAPMDVTSSDKSAEEYLSSGDIFFDTCRVWSAGSFLKDI